MFGAVRCCSVLFGAVRCRSTLDEIDKTTRENGLIFSAVFGPLLGDDMKATLLSKAGRPSLGQRFTSYDVFTSGEEWEWLKMDSFLGVPERAFPYYSHVWGGVIYQ